ncbi:MAG: glycosyltransferase family 9 protein [Candidatus Edwardsbacteria bacterium]|nr:glycosyltransferase family 9 protein [Candidatus Edwardsbacteria bacterium]MBU2594209.1 glycosyltransferase family 9 protein [Candidatus Edwardsbacteria bacterium]
MFKLHYSLNLLVWAVLCKAFKRSGRNIDSLCPAHILVMLNGQIGDVVQTTPVLRSLKTKWPKAEIDYCVCKNSMDGLTNNPNIRQIVKADEYGPWSLLKPVSIIKLARTLKKNNYDLAVCLGNDATYGIVARMAGIKYIAGLIDKEYKNAFLDLYVYAPYNEKRPRVEYFRMLGESIRLDFAKGLLPEVFWTKQDEALIDGIIKAQNKPLIAIFAGTGPNAFRPWAKRSWPVKNWAELIQKLLTEYPDAGFVLLGRGGDREVNKEIILSAKAENICDLTDKTTYPQLAYALSKCNLLVSTDSSPVFAAAAVNCPLVVMYGPEWPQRSQPVGAQYWRPVTIDMVCREYCCSFPAKAPVCNNECMKNIPAQQVLEMIKTVLK